MKWRVPGHEVDQRKLGERSSSFYSPKLHIHKTRKRIQLARRTRLEDCQARGLIREGAMDRSRWMKKVSRTIDDHDRCEWVNVSSGTGPRGLSRTKSREP